MSTGMNFTCISAFDATKDIIWSFSYKFESDTGTLGNCGFTTFLNFLSSQTEGGIDSGLGYGPYTGYQGASGNFLAIACENAGVFATNGNGFTTGATPIFNSITLRKGTDFQYLTSRQVDFNIVSNDWQTLRFQLTNLGNTLNIFHCDTNFNYNKVLSIDVSNIFYVSQQLYIGMSFATPINGSQEFKLRVKDFHFYGHSPILLPPVITSQTLTGILALPTSTMTLTSNVLGALPLYYKWYRNNTLIGGANSTTFDAPLNGTYKFTVSNSVGTVSSQDIIIS
jgi:hypothetical protein